MGWIEGYCVLHSATEKLQRVEMCGAKLPILNENTM